MVAKKNVFVIGVVAVILLGMGFVWHLFTSESITLKKSESNLQITLGSLVDARLYELNGSGLTDVSFIPEGSIIFRSQRHDIETTVSIITPENEIGDVLLFENSDGSRQLGDPFSIKDSVAVSPDGLHVAYAELNLDFSTTLYSEKISDWNINLIDVETEEIKTVGTGFSPQFIKGDSTILIYSTSDGIAGYDLVSGEEFLVLPELGVQDITKSAQVSPDGTYFVIFNETTRRYNIFTIVETSPLELSGFGETQVMFEKIAVTNEYVYGVARNQETNEHTLWRYAIEDLSLPFAEGELLHTFAEGELPYQIIP